MRAFLIDPMARAITEVDYSGDYNDIYKLCDYDTFALVTFTNESDGVFVDDNGLINGKPRYVFTLNHPDLCEPHPLVGKGLVLGCDEDGNSTEPKITLEALKACVTFLGRR